jgi:hypothetical protein
LRSNDVDVSPPLRPTNHLDLVFEDGQERFQANAGDPLVGVGSGSSASAWLWLDYDLVPA